MNRLKMVSGVGRNDAGYPVTANKVIDGRNVQIWICPFYRVWSDMIKRCYSRKVQGKRPNYIGCTVAPEWHSFSVFREWMAGQQWEGMQLDKDILYFQNKVYSAETCVFVSSQINSFSLDCGSARGLYPTGVYMDKKRGRLAAMCCNPFTGKRENLGYFTDATEAHEAWRAKKHELACRYADQQSDSRIAEALRKRYA